jgi:NAD(P)-dependent dehydrogenase (short-subunit alcohol dehydrogenase family)
MDAKSVLITGASAGFGKLFAETFLAAGWQVYIGLRGGDKRLQEVYASVFQAHPEWR